MATNKSEKYIRGAIGFNDVGTVVPQNTPSKYGDRQTQFMAQRSIKFDAQRAYLATDYVLAEVQGLQQDFFAWTTTKIRLSDISKKDNSSLNGRKSDDRKEVLFPEINVDYFPIGAKIQTMGSTWICINPSNVSSVKTTAIVARCNATYNSYDEYGNIVTEPLVVESYQMAANDNTSSPSMALMDGYFKVICQLNDNTAKLHENSRIILGTKAYHITGVTNFMQEFTGDRESCHYLTFNARVEEPTELDDVSVDFIAGAKSVSFDVAVYGHSELSVGRDTQLNAAFIRNGEQVDNLPLAWDWSSSDEEIATVDENGNVTGVSVGECEIVATLVQNTDLYGIFKLVVSAFETESISFVNLIPSKISQFETAQLTAVVFVNGNATNERVTWSFVGASKECYDVETSDDGNTVTITCLAASELPLAVSATYGNITKGVAIELEGY